MRNLFGCFGRRSSSSRVFCSRGRRETNTIERSRKARAKSLPLFREESCRCSRRRRRYHCQHHHRSCNKRRRRGRSRVLLRTWYHGTIFTTFSTQKFTCVCVLSRSRVHVHLYAFTVSEREIILLLLEHAVQAENLLQTVGETKAGAPKEQTPIIIIRRRRFWGRRR